jgi:hypothetical protein
MIHDVLKQPVSRVITAATKASKATFRIIGGLLF